MTDNGCYALRAHRKGLFPVLFLFVMVPIAIDEPC
jgi:hypothetical protein